MNELNEDQMKEAMFSAAAELAEKMDLTKTTNLDDLYDGDTVLLATETSILIGKLDVDSGYMKSCRYEHYRLNGDTLWTNTYDTTCGWEGELTVSRFLSEDAIIYKGY